MIPSVYGCMRRKTPPWGSCADLESQEFSEGRRGRFGGIVGGRDRCGNREANSCAGGPGRARSASVSNDHIQIALIGAGGQGMGNTKTAVQVPGVKLVAVADCYDGRLARSKELWGDDVFTTVITPRYWRGRTSTR